ncbi:hypothetical protein [Corynebacterium sp. SA-MJD20WY100]|uniref:hypothetical protein n=1 Tax=Corynebacterium sp. SA-MJD20WY100 TaxID=3142969 RepID=UPI003221430E
MNNDDLLFILGKSREIVDPEESPRTAQLIGVVEADLEVGKEFNANRLLSHLIVALANIEKSARSK